MKKVLFSTLVALVGILSSFAQAQVIPLTVDSSQSSVDITISGSTSSSQLSGTATLDIQSTSPPSGNAQITDLDLVLDNGLSYSFFLGAFSATSSPGDVTLSLVTPGAPGTISGNSFDQLGNLLAFSGDLDVSDFFGVAGGSQTVDLSTIDLSLFDFDSVSVTQSGNAITVSQSLTFTESLDLGATSLPVVVQGTYVASGVVPVTVLKGDVDMSGVVDFDDIPAFIAVLIAGEFQAEADVDCSTAVDFSDIPAFVAVLQGQ